MPCFTIGICGKELCDKEIRTCIAIEIVDENYVQGVQKLTLPF